MSGGATKTESPVRERPDPPRIAWLLPICVAAAGGAASHLLAWPPAGSVTTGLLTLASAIFVKRLLDVESAYAGGCAALVQVKQELRQQTARVELCRRISKDAHWGMRSVDVGRVATRHLAAAFPAVRVTFSALEGSRLRVLDSREPNGMCSLIGQELPIPAGPWLEELEDAALFATGDARRDDAWRELSPSLDRVGVRSLLAFVIQIGDAPTTFLSLDSPVPDALGEVEAVALRAAGESLRLALVQANRVAEIRHDALHDQLTGLPNRDLFRDRLAQALGRARRDPRSRFSVLFLDFDGFKVINESLGHESGDKLLVALAGQLRDSVRSTDTTTQAPPISARLGGDEFVVLLEGAGDAFEVERVVRRLQEALVRPYTIDGHEVMVTASIGIVLVDGEYESTEAILRDADTAMYRAKRAGKGGHVFFDAAMHTVAMDRLNLEHSLRRAVVQEQFTVAYQPILRLSDLEVVGFEALSRWTDSERGAVGPGEFIPLAEEIGVIGVLGERVLRDALRQLRVWHDRHPGARDLTMSVNVSPRQLGGNALLVAVQNALARDQLSPSVLRIEVTESGVMDDPENAGRVLRALADLGVKLSIDDFGTGHSSLGNLERYPFDVLKIDRSFVDRLGQSSRQLAILDTIVDLAHQLGMTVVAEGVEKEEQEHVLGEIECDLVQGYRYSRPMTVEQADAFLAERY